MRPFAHVHVRFAGDRKYESMDYVGLTNDFWVKEQWSLTRQDYRNLTLSRWC